MSQKTRKIFCTKLSRESPVVELSSNELLRSKARFLVDTGADSTIATVNNELLKSKMTFHVVYSDFPISTDGIIGREYL